MAISGVWTRAKSHSGRWTVRSRLIKSTVIDQFTEGCEGSGKPEPLLANSSLLRVAPRDLARGVVRLGQEALQGLEDLLGKFAVEFPNLLRVRKEGLARMLGEFGLNLDGLVE
jgi:hypothetical protein